MKRNRCYKPELVVLLLSLGVCVCVWIWVIDCMPTLLPLILSFAGGDSSVVRAPDSWSKGRGLESLVERRENFLLQGQLSVRTLISVSVPPPCYRSSTKRSRSFCQKRRWQVTAKHAYTLRTWLCMKWHGAWLYGVHRTRRDGSSFLSMPAL